MGAVAIMPLMPGDSRRRVVVRFFFVGATFDTVAVTPLGPIALGGEAPGLGSVTEATDEEEREREEEKEKEAKEEELCWFPRYSLPQSLLYPRQPSRHLP